MRTDDLYLGDIHKLAGAAQFWNGLSRYEQELIEFEFWVCLRVSSHWWRIHFCEDVALVGRDGLLFFEMYLTAGFFTFALDEDEGPLILLTIDPRVSVANLEPPMSS